SVLADYYNRFDTADARIDQLLVGPQKVLGGPSAGDQAYDRYGDSLIFTVESPLIDATESDGVRILKWPIDPDMDGSNAGNDYAVFRYSHILLAKAEAQFMLGSTGDALALVNLVRARNFDPDQPLASVTRDDIFNERGYELLWEGFRRQDQIRTGHFLEAWSNKDANTADEYRKLFPIPQFQMDANPNLAQNPGYGTVGIATNDGQDLLPEVYALRQNYPNPFNPKTTITYELPKETAVNISICNIVGQLVEALVSEHKSAGFHSVVWDAGDVGSGVYLYRLRAGEYT
ncbi:MAG: RagB/SusD family nutrient uptake outer membrane protein, partial [Candidatus Marinimicrobia bacterium]|nr:RagB/SusD family nutrient uptake outer membrane protein [Candidatus Neomarinimicrobiota bacterium]